MSLNGLKFKWMAQLTSDKKKVGALIEKEALEYLELQGLVLIEANFASKIGEIDLIMLDGEVYVFVEVRFRKISGYGDGAESVTRSKQNKIIRTAKLYLQEKKIYDKVLCRFDVVAANLEQEKSILWIKNAFWVKW